MIKNVVQNNDVNGVVDPEIELLAKNIIGRVMALDSTYELARIATRMVAEAIEGDQVLHSQDALTVKQREILREKLPLCISAARKEWLEDSESKYRIEVLNAIREQLLKIPAKILTVIAEEINRGAIVTGEAVCVNTKGKAFNVLEFRYDKEDGSIAAPTRGLFISNNCMDIVLNSIESAYSDALGECPKDSDAENGEND